MPHNFSINLFSFSPASLARRWSGDVNGMKAHCRYRYPEDDTPAGTQEPDSLRIIDVGGWG